jgi:hypothetical protein
VVRTFLLPCPATYALVEIGLLSYQGRYIYFSSWFEKNKFFEKKIGKGGIPLRKKQHFAENKTEIMRHV